MDTHLKVLIDRFPMNTNKTGFRQFINIQGLSQDKETGCLKLAIIKFFQASCYSMETTIYTDYNPKQIYLFFEKMHDDFIQCHENCIEVE